MAKKAAPTSPGRITVDRELMRTRNDRLDQARSELKSVFVGIDAIVDEIIDCIRVWYLMPEVLTRPLIVNLWGMTGVGKTDLVRRLVRALDFQERFAEVELSNGDTTSWITSVSTVLDRNTLNDSRPKIVLFDEIQRFNTLDTDGKPIQDTKFTDFWELLSDGRLARRERASLDSLYSEVYFGAKDSRRRKDRGEDVDPDSPIGIWQAQSLRQTFGLEESVEDLAGRSNAELLPELEHALRRKRIYEPVDHSSTLILVSGNLDDAFQVARMTDEADVDADIFHAFTEKISVVDIKQALTKRFKPEQVSRFGNIHLIYPSLRRADFEELIAKEIARIVASTKERFGIDVHVGDAIAELIYRNGVFPSQGVRPVLSSVIDVLERNLAFSLFEAISQGATRIDLDYDAEKSEIRASLDGATVVTRPFTGRLDQARQRRTGDVLANVSVHEAGHAVAYAVEFGLAPLQLTSRIAATYAAGFTFPHDVLETRDSMVRKIRVLLAGGLAEEVVFGEADATIGRGEDREKATMLALDYVRRYGFDEEFQATYTMEFAYAMDKTTAETDVEKMMSRLVAQTRDILGDHRALLIDLSRRLNVTGSLTADEVAALMIGHGVEITTRPEGYSHLPRYAATLGTNGTP